MGVYLAEECKDTHLKLSKEEEFERRSSLDDYDPKKPCMHHVHIGLFFDGTNNNKYRDLPNNGASNVARLFEAYTGSPAKQQATYGGRLSKPLLVGIPENVIKSYYRKIYIPGLGTAMPEADDPGENLPFFETGTALRDKTRRLAMVGRH